MKPKKDWLTISLFALISLTLIGIGCMQIYQQYAYGYSSRWNVTTELFGMSAQIYGFGFILLGCAPLGYVYGYTTKRKYISIFILSAGIILGTLCMIFAKQISSLFT
jgi:hypothetical protein